MLLFLLLLALLYITQLHILNGPLKFSKNTLELDSSRSTVRPVTLNNASDYYTDEEVTTENYFPDVGNIPQGRRTRGIFPTEGK